MSVSSSCPVRLSLSLLVILRLPCSSFTVTHSVTPYHPTCGYAYALYAALYITVIAVFALLLHTRLHYVTTDSRYIYVGSRYTLPHHTHTFILRYRFVITLPPPVTRLRYRRITLRSSLYLCYVRHCLYHRLRYVGFPFPLRYHITHHVFAFVTFLHFTFLLRLVVTFSSVRLLVRLSFGWLISWLWFLVYCVCYIYRSVTHYAFTLPHTHVTPHTTFFYVPLPLPAHYPTLPSSSSPLDLHFTLPRCSYLTVLHTTPFTLHFLLLVSSFTFTLLPTHTLLFARFGSDLMQFFTFTVRFAFCVHFTTIVHFTHALLPHTIVPFSHTLRSGLLPLHTFY